MISAIVTDIEGTTTSVSFVYDVLFPYAREHMREYIHVHHNDPIVIEQLEEIDRLTGKSLTRDEAIEQLHQWMDEDSKITPLKTLQGLMWLDGYKKSKFRGHIYPDVPPNLHRWHELGIALYVYSSGSVQAQKLLFGHSDCGDLAQLFSGFFDTTTGIKQEPISYYRIAESTGFPAPEILFLSDLEEELDAAASAGMQTLLLDRDDNKSSKKHNLVRSFDEIQIS